MSQSRVGENSNSFNNNTNSNIVNNFGSADERAEILEWLSPLEPQLRHNDIRAHRVKDVGGWLLRTEEYQSWFHGIRLIEPDNSVLFCYGDPGVGKTYISSLVIDKLCDWAKGRNAAVAYFYFDFASQNEQSPTAVLSSLLKQVVRGLPEIPANIVQAFRDQGKVIGGRKLELDEIVHILRNISFSRPTFMCLDALDECTADYRTKLLDSLRRILRKSPTTRISLAGRLHIKDEVEKYLAEKVVAVSVTPTKDDIVRFLRARLEEDTTPDAMDKVLEEDIIKTIPETFPEIFLLVSLYIKVILQETTLHRRREKLGTITNGLGLANAYGAAMGRIRAQEGDRARLGMAALMWISHSERPLNLDEICHALAIEIGSADINTNNVPSIRTVLDCCQGLAAVDKGSSTIKLIHFTLKEYLSDHADLFDGPHSKIAEACLMYLNFQTIKDLSASPSPDLQGTPFLGYCSLYWGRHIRMELSDRSRYLALRLLNQYSDHISAKLLWGVVNDLQFTGYTGFIEAFSALHCTSYFGIAEIAIDLIRAERWDMNQRDSAGLTPLMWAARYGHEEVVKLLLQQKHTQPNVPDTRYGRTALSWAAGSGHEGVVRLFLDPSFVNPGTIGRRWGETRQVMRLLVGRKYVNPSKPDDSGRTPLWWAAGDGNDGVVRFLLEQGDVTLNRPDNYGRTPLSRAAENGQDRVVRLLLGQGDLGPDKPDNNSRTPLSWAAENGNAGVVRLLLERKDVNPDRPESGGQTPLSWAAENGRVGVMKLLLERGDVNPNSADTFGQDTLLWASKNGHDQAVRLLLERGDVTPDKPDKYGRTPLSWAARNGCDGAVKLLLEREDINPNRPDGFGQTPLSWAAENGHVAVVELLMKRKDVSLDQPVNHGQTPVSLAAGNGHVVVVKLINARKAATPSSVPNVPAEIQAPGPDWAMNDILSSSTKAKDGRYHPGRRVRQHGAIVCRGFWSGRCITGKVVDGGG